MPRQTKLDETPREYNLKEYQAELDLLVENFETEIKDFARGGDERDSIPSYEAELKDLKQRIQKDDLLTKKDKKELITEIDDELKHEEKVCDLAKYHQMSMARHESGSSYYETYAKLLEAIGQ